MAITACAQLTQLLGLSDLVPRLAACLPLLFRTSSVVVLRCSSTQWPQKRENDWSSDAMVLLLSVFSYGYLEYWSTNWNGNGCDGKAKTQVGNRERIGKKRGWQEGLRED